MPLNLTEESGFYFKDSMNRLVFASSNVHGPGWDLFKNEFESYTYPFNGWIWAYTKEEARTFFNLPDIEQRSKEIEQAIQAHLDSTVQLKGFDNMVTAVSYNQSHNLQYRKDALIAEKWRDDVWDFFFRFLPHYQNGEHGELSNEAIIELLPKINWEP